MCHMEMMREEKSPDPIGEIVATLSRRKSCAGMSRNSLRYAAICGVTIEGAERVLETAELLNINTEQVLQNSAGNFERFYFEQVELKRWGPESPSAQGWRMPIGITPSWTEDENSPARGPLNEKEDAEVEVCDWSPDPLAVYDDELMQLENTRCEMGELTIEERERVRFLRRSLRSALPWMSETAKRISASDHARVDHHNQRDYQGGTLTVDEWILIKLSHENKCVYCGSPATVLEHMNPLSRGGRTNKHNVVPSCRGCNIEKGTSTVEEWLYGDRLKDFERRMRQAKRRMRQLKAKNPQA